jgi:uncharacterized cupredoxin-like copper-binding protein
VRKLLAVTMALVLFAAIAGCGGDDETTTNARTSEGSTGTPVETVRVSETDFKLDPQNPRVDRPGLVAFEITNDGETTHNVEVEAPAGEVELAQDLAPGESGTLEVNLDRAGTYEWYCPIGNHRDLGMEGEIRVGGGAGGQTTGTTETETTTTGTTETETTETETTGTTETGEDNSGGGSNGGSGGGGY